LTITNQYAPISMTKNRTNIMTNYRYSIIRVPPPNKDMSVPPNPTIMPMVSVIRIVISVGSFPRFSQVSEPSP
jgi:hypothetical protein